MAPFGRLMFTENQNNNIGLMKSSTSKTFSKVSDTPWLKVCLIGIKTMDLTDLKFVFDGLPNSENGRFGKFGRPA